MQLLPLPFSKSCISQLYKEDLMPTIHDARATVFGLAHHAHLLDLLTTQERRALTTGLTGLIRAMESHAYPRGQAPVANDR